MPWDDTTLVVADLIRSGEKGEKLSIDGPSRRVVAGGNGKGVSAMEPVWFLSSSSSDPGSTEFRLAFISDETGWWNVYAEGEGGGERRDNFFSKVSLLPFFCLREERKNPRSPPPHPPFCPSLPPNLPLEKTQPRPATSGPTPPSSPAQPGAWARGPSARSPREEAEGGRASSRGGRRPGRAPRSSSSWTRGRPIPRSPWCSTRERSRALAGSPSREGREEREPRRWPWSRRSRRRRPRSSRHR